MSAEILDFDLMRTAMVDNQLRTFSVTDRRVLACMLGVPRHLFVQDATAAIAYSDRALEVIAGSRRKMLPPMFLARMLQSAGIGAGDRVLDVGGAAGYSAAVAAGLGAGVIALEASEDLVKAANLNFQRAGILNARAVAGLLEAGFAAGAPYDVIIINGMIETVPETLLDQLADKGRLLAIRRQADDPTGRAGKAVRYLRSGQAIGMSGIFDATAPVLPGFASIPAFAF